MLNVKFIVAEKSYLIRKGMVSIINRIDNALVVYEMEDLELLNSKILEHRPDFLVLNPSLLPSQEEFRNFEIKTDLSATGIAIIPDHHQRKGLLHKFRAVININDKKAEIIQKLSELIEPIEESRKKIIRNNELSEREKTILTYVAKGFTNKEIADKLFLSAHTVMTHRKNITNKLGIKTISGLTIYAILNNLVSMEDLK